MGLKSKFMNFFDLEDDPYMDEESEEARESKPEPFVSKKKNVVSLQSVQQHSKVVLFEPKAYAEAEGIAGELKNHRVVVMNFQNTYRDQARRIIDFLSGVVLALDGNIQKLGPHTFLCTPDHIDVSGAISEIMDDID